METAKLQAACCDLARTPRCRTPGHRANGNRGCAATAPFMAVRNAASRRCNSMPRSKITRGERTFFIALPAERVGRFSKPAEKLSSAPQGAALLLLGVTAPRRILGFTCNSVSLISTKHPRIRCRSSFSTDCYWAKSGEKRGPQKAFVRGRCVKHLCLCPKPTAPEPHVRKAAGNTGAVESGRADGLSWNVVEPAAVHRAARRQAAFSSARRPGRRL